MSTHGDNKHHRLADTGRVDLSELVDRVPEGWTAVTYRGNRWGMSRRSRASGRSIAVYAEELQGNGVVSANVYRTEHGDQLRPCEMPAEIVLAFLQEWKPERPLGDSG